MATIILRTYSIHPHHYRLLIIITTTTESPFDLEGRMTPYSLYNVERRGVQLRREISSKNRDFQAVLRLKQPDANSALFKWLNSSNKSDIKPTWRNLFLILHLVNLDKLAEEIETHLGGTYVKQLSKGTSSTEQERGSEFDNLWNCTQI